ncbi:MAG: disulfide bond formation protein B [Campylobacter gracilis]|uniref:disulfide bond formation protein B n=1 Tax=Campylobacter gracilis TaxID=824 RepID=UPI0026F361F8|nr:disulfide bond formation protein B [Campylobacter gracilis]MBS6152887.1 disulfide bond formation protein B [Campylobacter gracilis]
MILKFQNRYSKRFLAFCAIWALFWLAFSYFFLQKFLFIYPESFSIHVRFALCAIALGAVILAVCSKDVYGAICGYVVWFYGAALGFVSSLNLAKIHTVLRGNGDMSGMSGCGGAVRFLNFDLSVVPIFKPFNSCAFDVPAVPAGAALEGLQAKLTALYSGGWYLFPTSKSVDLAQFWSFIFIFFAIIWMIGIFLGFINRKAQR